jgi:hypothetical protein
MRPAKSPSYVAPVTRMLSSGGKFIASMLIVEEAELIAYDIAGHKIPYVLLFTLYGYL